MNKPCGKSGSFASVEAMPSVRCAGNIKQSLESNGLPKAMARLGLDQNGNQAIINCYNTVTGKSGATCGFTLTGGHLEGTSYYYLNLDFKFPIYRRFIMFTADSASTTARVFNPGNGGQETRTILDIDDTFGTTQATIIIY